MTIRTTLTGDFKAFDDMIEFVDNLSVINQFALEEAANAIEPDLLNELQTEPPKRSYPNDYPLEWESDKQRKAYFATDGFGAGIPYKRTGKLAAGWTTDIVTNGLSVSFVIENPSSAAKYVYGSLAQDINAASRFQQQFHRITGWQSVAATVDFYLDAMIEQYQDTLDGQIRDFGQGRLSRRAYTSPTRRS